MSDDRDATPGPTFATGTLLGTKFSITRQLGRGGMGTVYEGQQIALRRRVAIKTLNPELARNKDLRARFVREGELAARIRHPNVIEVIDVGEHEGTPFLVLEFLEGEDLGQRLGRLGRLSLAECADLLLPVCAAIASAHEIGVIHRDLKPENIFLLTPARGPVIPKVVDFGISKLVDGATQTPSSINLTAEGAILGTPLYLAPEVAGGAKNLDAKSDQYTFGVILYECATGRRPFTASNLADLVGQILMGRYERPSAVVEDMDPAFEAIVMRAMHLEKSGRFNTMWALGRALLPFASERVRSSLSDQFLGGNSVNSERPPPSAEPQRSPVSAPRTDAETLAQTAIDVASQRQPIAPPRSPLSTVAVAASLSFAVAIGAFALRARSAASGSITAVQRSVDADAAAQAATVTPAPSTTPDASAAPPPREEPDASQHTAASATDASEHLAVTPDASERSATTVVRRPSARDAGRRVGSSTGTATTSSSGNGQTGSGSGSFIE